MKSFKSFFWFILISILAFLISGLTILSFQNSAVQADGLKLSELKRDSIYSKYLKKVMKINVYLPKGYSKKNKYPVLYMLHGYGPTKADSWMPNLKLEKKADQLIAHKKIRPLIIVTPQMDNSWGINSAPFTETIGTPPTDIDKGMYEDYFLKEIMPYIDSKYSTDAKREQRYIGGLSMGGFIALRTAFLHSDLFSKAGGHSAAIILDNNPNVSGLISFLFPDENLRKDRDPIYLAKVKDLSRLRIYLDCGDKDEWEFNKGCELLNKILQQKKVASEYHLNPGKHNAEYWEANAEKYLIFYGGY